MRKMMMVAALLATLVSAAQAVTFEGSSEGIFGVPSGPPEMVYGGDGTSVFTTGTPSEGGDPNSLEFVGVDFSTPEETPFVVGELIYSNTVTVLGTNAEMIPIEIELTFTSPFGDVFTFDYAFDLEVTPNTPGDVDDILTIGADPSSTTFDYDGVTYTLALLGFSTDGGATFVDEFVLPENETVESELIAKITSEVDPIIPEPATMALLGLGLAGFGVIRRRR